MRVDSGKGTTDYFDSGAMGCLNNVDSWPG